jgi:putative iron-only hydrogenase system regulator
VKVIFHQPVPREKPKAGANGQVGLSMPSRNAGRYFFWKGGPDMQKRMGMIGIFVRERDEAAQSVNRCLSDYAQIIVARTGVPYRERGLSVISVIVDGTTDEIGALAGKLGSIQNVTVRSMMAPMEP